MTYRFHSFLLCIQLDTDTCKSLHCWCTCHHLGKDCSNIHLYLKLEIQDWIKRTMNVLYKYILFLHNIELIDNFTIVNGRIKVIKSHQSRSLVLSIRLDSNMCKILHCCSKYLRSHKDSARTRHNLWTFKKRGNCQRTYKAAVAYTKKPYR